MSDIIPLGVAICCREWVVAPFFSMGKCGLCGTKPTFDHMLPEEEWITPAPPIRPESLGGSL